MINQTLDITFFLVRLILSFEIQCFKADGVSDEIEVDSDSPLLTIANQMTDVEEGIKLLHTGYDSSKSFTNKYFLDIDILKQVNLPSLVHFRIIPWNDYSRLNSKKIQIFHFLV